MDEVFFVWIEKLWKLLFTWMRRREGEGKREAGLSRETPRALVFPQRLHSAKPGFRLQV